MKKVMAATLSMEREQAPGFLKNWIASWAEEAEIAFLHFMLKLLNFTEDFYNEAGYWKINS